METTDLPRRVATFVQEQVFPREAALDSADGAVLRDLQVAARQAGLWALPLPEALGGQGLTLEQYAELAEAEGASDHGPAALGSAPLLDVRMLARHGSGQIQSRYLRSLTDGTARACYAMTEPGSPGTDPARTATTATLRGGWVVTGRKWFVSGAANADVVTVLARTDGQPGDRDGLSLLAVPTSSPGFRVVRELPILGTTAQWDIEFDHVVVPADHLLGERGQGLAIAGERLQLGRTLRSLRWLGQAQRAFDLLHERCAGTPIADHQLVQQKVFESLLLLRSTRPLVHAAVAKLVADQDARIEVGLAKFAAARALSQITDAAIQVHGAAGLGPDTALPALFRTARTARILDGPDELQIASVARKVLRTPLSDLG